MKIAKKRVVYLSMVLAMLIALAAFGWNNGANAGPTIVGNPDGSNLKALVRDNTNTVIKIVYFAPGVKTMANTTPVSSAPKCGNYGDLHSAQVQLVGTMTGTNPTLAVLWYNSIDGGVTWTAVGTWTTINATVTPATQNQTVSDIRSASTAVAYGDCWKATYTFGGTGTVTANISINGIEK